MAMNQAPKLARLLVRESPGLPSLTIFDHDTGRVAGGDLKRAGRERYSHCAPLNGAKVGSRPRQAVHSVGPRPARRYSPAQSRPSASASAPQGSHEPTLTFEA